MSEKEIIKTWKEIEVGLLKLFEALEEEEKASAYYIYDLEGKRIK